MKKHYHLAPNLIMLRDGGEDGEGGEGRRGEGKGRASASGREIAVVIRTSTRGE